MTINLFESAAHGFMSTLVQEIDYLMCRTPDKKLSRYGLIIIYYDVDTRQG